MAAEYMDGQRASALRVRLECETGPDGTWLLILADTEAAPEQARWYVGNIKLEGSASSDDPVLHLHYRPLGGALLSAPRSEVPAQVLALLEGKSRFPVLLQSRKHQLATFTLLLVLFGTSIAFSLPALSRSIAHKIPVRWEQAAATKLLEALNEKSHPALEVLVNRLRPLAGQPGADLDYRALLIQDSMVNAFALPGGVILVHCGLIKKAGSSNEVAGILAHEMQHVVHRHVLSGLVRGAILTGIWSLAVGDYSGVVVLDPQTMYQLASLKFSRDDEEQADVGALAMLDRVGIPTQGMADFFRRLGSQEPAFLKMISTHPASAARVKLFEKAQGLRPEADVALTAQQWSELRTACP